MKTINVLTTRQGFTITDEMVDALNQGEDVLLKAPKPQMKIIDLSMMVGSDILCEFRDTDQECWHIGRLIEKGKTSGFRENDGTNWNECRIMENHWHSWEGRANCPLPEGLIVEVIYRGERNGILLPEYTEATWTWRGLDASDIIAFRILGTADNAYYEWDKDK